MQSVQSAEGLAHQVEQRVPAASEAPGPKPAGLQQKGHCFVIQMSNRQNRDVAHGVWQVLENSQRRGGGW